MRRLLAPEFLAPAFFAAALPGLSTAQDRLTLLDLFSVDAVVQRFVQSGILALRTQVDLKYGDLAVDLRTGRLTLTDVRLWPLPAWDEDGNCEIAFDRMTVRGAPIDQVDRLRFKVQVTGASFHSDCLPPEARQATGMLGLETVKLPRVTLDVDYGVPASDAVMRLYTEATDVAAVDLTANFAYVWFDGSDDMEEPVPVVFLKDATLTVENRGAWDVVKGLLPPPLTAEGSALFIEGALGGMLSEMNRDAAGPVEEGEGDPSALTDQQRAFLDSVTTHWPAFVADQKLLVLQTEIDGDVYVDFELIEDDPREMFEALRPRLSTIPARSTDLLPVALLSQAMGPDAATMSPAERLQVGEALITGTRAPRDVSAGMDLLMPLAEAGDGAAALLMSEALEVRDPETAYRWALLAGKAGETGATARLDRLERGLPLATVLEIQNRVSGEDTHPIEALASLGLIREQAAMRLSGQGQARSYGVAALWAMLAKAAGDPEAADILQQIDETVRLSGPSAMQAWTTTEADASRLAMQVWVGQDLPARFGP